MFRVFIWHCLDDLFLKLLIHLPIWRGRALKKYIICVISFHAAFHWSYTQAGPPPTNKIIVSSFPGNQLLNRCKCILLNTLWLKMTVISDRLYIIQRSDLLRLTALFVSEMMLIFALFDLCFLLILLNHTLTWHLLLGMMTVRWLFFDD